MATNASLALYLNLTRIIPLSGARVAVAAASPPPPRSNTLNEFGTATRLLYVLLISVVAMGLAMMLAIFARRRLHASVGRLFTIFLATVDFVTDNAFVIQMFEEGKTIIFVLSSVIIAASVISSLTLTIHLLYRSWLAERRAAGTADLDLEVLGRHAAAFAGILVLATTNLNLLILLPWRRTLYDGFPTARMLRWAQLTVFVEDLPQACDHGLALADGPSHRASSCASSPILCPNCRCADHTASRVHFAAQYRQQDDCHHLAGGFCRVSHVQSAAQADRWNLSEHH
jgi:hypothetical protein